jgi:hypothetical protein
VTPPVPIPDDEIHARFSRRLQGLTLCFGFAVAIFVVFKKSPLSGLGIAIGTLLAWLNFRWMDRGVEALVATARGQSGVKQPRVPLGVYGRFAGRYILIGALVYASVFFLHVPLVTVVLGLLALGAGALAEGLYEIIVGYK